MATRSVSSRQPPHKIVGQSAAPGAVPFKREKRSGRVFDSVEQYVSELGGTKPIHKILVANNGISAVKAIRSLVGLALGSRGRG